MKLGEIMLRDVMEDAPTGHPSTTEMAVVTRADQDEVRCLRNRMRRRVRS